MDVSHITLDLSFYWLSVGAICVCLSGQWAFRRLKSLITTRSG